MSLDPRLEQFKNKMAMSLDSFSRELSGIRTGRASTALLEPIKIEAYGGMMPLNQVGAISVLDSRMLSVNVWDKDLVKAVEKAIRECGACLNPVVDGQVVKVPIPPLSDERRRELSKLAAKYAEDSKVSLRNVRRDAMDFVKHLEKNDEVSEDEMRKLSNFVQELTDDFSKKVDSLLAIKQKDIVHI
ncbi:MAG: ribosome recycling factor [Holosporales bacterium]|jgi:ribosome recycling factor|nr:ribosome recycling factor [Holosporales bacterium]